MRKPIKEIEIERDDKTHTIMQVAQRLPPHHCLFVKERRSIRFISPSDGGDANSSGFTFFSQFFHCTCMTTVY